MKSIKAAAVVLTISVLLASTSYAFVEINLPSTIGIYVGIDDNKLFGAAGSQDMVSIAPKLTYTWFMETNYPNKTLTTTAIGNDFLYFRNMMPFLYTEANTLIFYISGHGAKSTDTSPNRILLESMKANVNTDNVITDMELANYIKYLPTEINKVVLIDSCYSGGFIPELELIDNINVITSATSGTESMYDKWSGRSYFSQSIEKYLILQGGKGFTFEDLARYLKSDEAYEDYLGRESYSSDLDDLENPHIFTANDWNVQTYQSPSSDPVPEPSSFLLAICGVVSLLIFKRR